MMLCVLISVEELSWESVLSRDSCESLVYTVDDDDSRMLACDIAGLDAVCSLSVVSSLGLFRGKFARSSDAEVSEAFSF